MTVKEKYVIPVQHLCMDVPNMKSIIDYVGVSGSHPSNIIIKAPYPFPITVSSNFQKYTLDDPKFRKMRAQVFTIMNFLMKKKVEIRFGDMPKSLEMIEKLNPTLYLEYSKSLIAKKKK